ncbi:neutral/alkaline non-lysosomal ceramidase N-terminal domain-containing protein [Natronincola ferrireducens]|uniref:Neutral/alkaline non-lysosomal ceramidase, N-terminal n=1 Tax=Natronincola ferrireducens TaxID=393762 RepID=A0A1G8YS22_9FIRM|nr:neutral/alkaline non-lysosomal ceramidase N-terminal domain-containing protein [Natronincola ferrireducens]SDK05649.1 Neutral/alkaline non-lysosomal ceramidase, N-terminal [Natronincola ferrireducens]
MYLGVSKMIITPPHPVRLCGYGNRIGTFKDVKEDIYLRIQIHSNAEKTIVFIYGDVLWWGSDFVAEIKPKLEGKFHLQQEDVFFVASHNHSGPPTSKKFTNTLETYDENYTNFLKEKIFEGIRVAFNNMEEVTGKLHTGTSRLNVFRRLKVGEKIMMAPNYKIDADHGLTIIGLYRKNQSLKGMIVHYPCHANISNENDIQPDYPGVALRMLDQKFANSVSIFLQGCTGDLRPNTVLGDKFSPGSYESVVKFARSFYEDCLKTMDEDKGVSLKFILKTSKKEVKLSQENFKKEEEIKKLLHSDIALEKEWAEQIIEKKNRDYEVLEINKISYANEISFLTFNAEISQYYSEFVKSLDKKIISIAYTNGMVGYICTNEQIVEGGYEPKESALYFALSGTYKPEIEEVIHNSIKELL